METNIDYQWWEEYNGIAFSFCVRLQEKSGCRYEDNTANLYCHVTDEDRTYIRQKYFNNSPEGFEKALEWLKKKSSKLAIELT